MDLSNLTDKQLAELQAEIEETKKRRAKDKAEAHRQQMLTAYGVKITCPTCEGTGQSYPPNWEPGDCPDDCRTCNGYGYIWAPKHRAWTAQQYSQIAEAFTEWGALENI